MGYDILSRPFDNGLVEETSIPVPSNRPVLFVSLLVVSFFFGN
jgi:hypothetical protein